MSELRILIVATCFLVGIMGCQGSRHNVEQTQEETGYRKLEQAQQSVALALEYHDQGGFEKSARLFLEAADFFNELNLKEEERSALVAAAKMQLKCSLRQPFLPTMARYRGLLDRYELPPEEERLLVNLSDHMKGNPLTYPVMVSWQIIFQH